MNKQEEKHLVELLSKLEPGFYPLEIFLQFARLSVLSIVEFVPLRIHNGKTEILLLKRPEHDEIWQGEVHTPGTVVRPTDTEGGSYQAYERIEKEELLGTKVSSGHFVGSIFHPSKRGMENAQVFWVEVIGDPKVGKFYDTDNLPENLMDSQRGFIAEAIRNFNKNKSKP